MSRLTELMRRAKLILQTEGLIPLFKRLFPFVIGCLCRCENYYLYEEAIEDTIKLNEAGFLPQVDNITFKEISTCQGIDFLKSEGFNLGPWLTSHRDRLDKGAIAFYIFVGHELAHLNWAATSQGAMKSLGQPPYKVHFSDDEVCTGSYWTHPKYRGKGLAKYANFKTRQCLWERGKRKIRTVTRKDNIASQKSYAKNPATIQAEARYLKILWWKSWKEKPLDQP